LRRFRRISWSILAGWWRGLFVSSLILLLLPIFAAAQEDQTSRYVYDDDGRLRAVIAPNGEAAVYEYDSAGNFTAIRRLGADALELLTFAPRSGVVGTRVVFYGVGFGAGVSTVTFGGGVVGTLVGFTNTTITAIVPEGAITGPVTINTARGTLTTATPFVLQGIILNPREVSVLDGESVQFNATVIVPGDDQEVSWSVNGVEGGSGTLGRITPGGLYTAPPDPPATFDVSIQAVSLAFPALVGTATVHVRSLSDFRFTLSPGVSIGKGEGFTNASALSQGVSVGKGAGYTYGVALSRGVSVGKGADFANVGVFSPGVSLTKGPVISAVSPGSIAQGSNGTVTLNGANFGGANGVRLFNPDGSETFGVTASDINVSGNGSSLTVNLSVQSGASVGRKIIVVTTPTKHSVRSDVNVNAIQITAP
jgi:YD repeat-containing protein